MLLPRSVRYREVDRGSSPETVSVAIANEISPKLELGLVLLPVRSLVV